MHVELIGCTSTGKSTLFDRIRHELGKQGKSVLTSYDFVLEKLGLRRLAPRGLRMAVLNLYALFVCILSWHTYRGFIGYALRCIRMLPAEVPLGERLKIARIAARNLGIHEIMSRHCTNSEVVIADEGALQIAHYPFFQVAVAPNPAQIEAFAQQVPCPDSILYLRQPFTVLFGRTLKRGHKRIPGNDPAHVEQFIQRAGKVFERLAQHPRIHGKLMIIDENLGIIPAEVDHADPDLTQSIEIIRQAWAEAPAGQ